MSEEQVVSFGQQAPAAGEASPAQDPAPRPRPSQMPIGAAFEARRDQTLAQAERYSRFVRTLKVLLPLVAFAILAATMLFVLLYDADESLTVSFTSVEHVDNDLRMVNPRFSGVDNERRPFLVTAEAAIQDAADPRTVTLETIQADMTLGEEAWVSVSAEQGVLNTEAETLVLEGAIDLYSDTGYEFHTDSAVVQFGERSVLSNSAVQAQGPLGTLRADSFMANDAGETLRFDGNVRMLIYPPDSQSGSLAVPATDTAGGN